MKHLLAKFKKYPAFFLTFLLTMGILGVAAGSGWAATLPAKAPAKTGVAVYANSRATVDASNLAEGYLTVKYTGSKNVKIKVQITKEGSGISYTYNLNNQGKNEVFPLTEGNGNYTVKVFENTGGNKYAMAHSVVVSLTLRDEFLPFLYPNQYVNFSPSSKTVAKAAALVKGQTDPLEQVKTIFAYVTTTLTYDHELAKTVQSGYLPKVDQVLAAKKGICFDYAALMAAMLRSQNIPCKLVVGYAGSTYHAWINVYVEGTGWLEKVIYFDGKDWTLLDPTFVSSGNHSDKIMKYVTDKTNYTQKFAY